MHAAALSRPFLDRGHALPARLPFAPSRTEYRPMTATPANVRELEGILKSVERGRYSAATNAITLADALRRAIEHLKTAEQHRSSVMWVLAALRQSMRPPRPSGGMWIIVDRDLHDWAMSQVAQLVGPMDGAQ